VKRIFRQPEAKFATTVLYIIILGKSCSNNGALYLCNYSIDLIIILRSVNCTVEYSVQSWSFTLMQLADG